MNYSLDGLPTPGISAPAFPSPASSPIATPSSHSGFDGANYSTKRGYISWHTLDTRKELDKFSRNELIRRIRWLHANVGFFKGIIENASMLIGWYTPLATTTDAEWNKKADENFESRTSSKSLFDSSGKFNFKTAQLMLNEARLKDGDILTYLTESPNKGARVAFYEGHQIRNHKVDKDQSWNDGVLVNPLNRHLAYNLVNDDVARVVHARDVIYFGRFQSVGNNRPHPPLAHAVNHAIDITEVWGDTKHGIKSASLFGLIIESAGDAGPQTKNVKGIEANLGAPATQTADDGSKFTTNQVWSGGQVGDPGNGKKVKVLTDNRPGPNQREFVVDLIRDIATGLGLPMEVVWHMAKLTGPGVRYILEFSEKWINLQRLELRDWCLRYWTYHMAKEIKAGRLPMPKDKNWIHSVELIPQRSLSIDRGRDGKQRMDEISSGHGTYADWCSDVEGGSWRKKYSQRVTEVSSAYELCGGDWESLTPEERYAKVFQPRQGAATADIAESSQKQNATATNDDGKAA